MDDPYREGPPGPDHVAVDAGIEGTVGPLLRAAARPEPEPVLVAERVGRVLGGVEALRRGNERVDEFGKKLGYDALGI